MEYGGIESSLPRRAHVRRGFFISKIRKKYKTPKREHYIL